MLRIFRLGYWILGKQKSLKCEGISGLHEQIDVIPLLDSLTWCPDSYLGKSWYWCAHFVGFHLENAILGTQEHRALKLVLCCNYGLTRVHISRSIWDIRVFHLFRWCAALIFFPLCVQRKTMYKIEEPRTPNVMKLVRIDCMSNTCETRSRRSLGSDDHVQNDMMYCTVISSRTGCMYRPWLRDIDEVRKARFTRAALLQVHTCPPFAALFHLLIYFHITTCHWRKRASIGTSNEDPLCFWTGMDSEEVYTRPNDAMCG